MTPYEFQQVQEQYCHEPVLFFFSIGTVNNTGDTIATEYTRDEMVRDCIAAIPLSEFAFEWNDGSFEAIPEISNSWVAVSPNAEAKGGGIYNARYEERVQEIVNKQW
jgi:hypothetical protein